MSKYVLNKFLYTVDRDPALVEQYREDPVELVNWWRQSLAPQILNCHEIEVSTWIDLTSQEYHALVHHDYRALFALGAHPFLTLTLFIALFERDYDEPLGFQLAYAAGLEEWKGLPYPDIST
ncbi:MAG: hypothetical protein ACP5O0_11140 [Acidimicrobiales bacterium]